MLMASLCWMVQKATETGPDIGALFTGLPVWTAHQADFDVLFFCGEMSARALIRPLLSSHLTRALSGTELQPCQTNDARSC